MYILVTIILTGLSCLADMCAAQTISYRFDTFEKVIGIELSKKDQIKILNNLFFETEENKDGTCKVTIPSWRNDINKNIDLIE